MSGMKTTQHNVLDLNHLREGPRTHTYGTPEALYQISKDAAAMSSVHTATAFIDTKFIKSSMMAKI